MMNLTRTLNKVCHLHSRLISATSLLLISLCFILSSCNQQGQNKTSPKVLKSIDKKALFEIINGLVKVLDRKDYSVKAGKNFLRPYMSLYKISLNKFPQDMPDSTDYLSVFVDDNDKNDPPELLAFRFYTPKKLSSQLSIDDFETYYEKGIQSPPFAESTTYRTVFKIKGRSNVTVSTESLKPMLVKSNVIKQIIVMR